MDILAKIFGKRFLYGILISVLFLLVVVLSLAFLTRNEEVAQAQKAFFYPETCLGGWKSAKNASGVPEALSDKNYNANNSAVFKDGDAAIFCGEFKGELPPQTYQTRVTLRFSWQQEPLESVLSEESTILDVLVDIFDGEDETESVDLDIEVLSEDNTATTTDTVKEESISTEESSDGSATSTDANIDNNSSETSEVVPEDVDTSVIEDVSEEHGFDTAEEVEEEIVPEPEPVEESVNESASEPVNDPVSWWRVFINTVYAEEAATSTEVVEVVNSEITITSTDTVTTTAEYVDDVIIAETEVVEDETNSVFIEEVEAIFAVEYTLDGEVWHNIGYVTTIDNDVRFELPKEAMVSIEDVSQVQIALRPLLRLNNMPEIYLDSMWFEVSYAPIRELGVHALSSLSPEVFGFEEFFKATSTVGASSTVMGMSAEHFLASTTFVHGLDSRYVLSGVPQGEVTELWLLDVDLREIKRIGFAEAAIGTYPLGAKDRMIFWLNYDASIIFTYDLRTGGSLHEMALVGNLPQDVERRFTFPFTDWQVIWRAEELYFFKDSPGEVFKDENGKAVDRLMAYLQNRIEMDDLEEMMSESASTTATTTEPEIATTTETQIENENI